MMQSRPLLATLTAVALIATFPLEGRGGRGSAFHGEGHPQTSIANIPGPSMSLADKDLTPQIANMPSQNGTWTAIAKPKSPPPPIDSAIPKPLDIEAARTSSPEHFAQMKNAADTIRSDIERAYPHFKTWFGKAFQENHVDSFYTRDEEFDPWKQSDWKAVTGWFHGLSTEPIYYDYDGDEGNVVYSDDSTVYIDGEPMLSTYAYSQQAKEIADQAPAPGDHPQQWLPLGVFVLTSRDSTVTTPNMVLQLVLSDQGDLSGTYYNILTNRAETIEGLVDKTSQRAVWRVNDAPLSPTIETGLYNLTQDQTETLVHFPDGTTQVWSLVRLENN